MTTGDASKALENEILDRLIEEKILIEGDRKKLIDKLAEGKLKPEDWRLAIEIAMEEKDHK